MVTTERDAHAPEASMKLATETTLAIKACMAATILLFPLACKACERDISRACQRAVATLIAYRAEAIAGAFGNFDNGGTAALQIRFASREDSERLRLARGISYDADNRTFWISRTVVDMALPNPLRSALYYWPFYQHENLRREFPIVEAVDNALWAAFLRDSAATQGLAWPHLACSSTVIQERLPCDMLRTGIARFVKVLRDPIINENRLDLIWPEDFAAFGRKVAGYGDREYLEVQRLGGLLLVRPLIREFGVLPTFAYVARNPFLVEDDNMRTSALRYQERAREALSQSELPRFTGTTAASDQRTALTSSAKK
jgi:hypothetical protein